ncbi:hypothetical protein CSUB01_07026 [Colletotrichum sublineola]|uniref:Uncharacterized protein n=1 Tax=Colletotrichum sublineola TaxID=1173701 RepID=A0A066WX62_COLSU|nr:hypothetical protein CSUB01_07026 [Colletotrichum sublineola]
MVSPPSLREALIEFGCMQLQEERRQTYYDSDDDDDDDSVIECDLEVCLVQQPVAGQHDSHRVTSDQAVLFGWSAVLDEVMRKNTAKENSKKTITDSSVVAATCDTNINSTAKATGTSQNPETDKNKTMGDKSGNGSSGGDYINAFKPINASLTDQRVH